MSTTVDHDWGTEPIPQSERTLSALNIGVLWGDLGIGLLVLVTGSFLTPILGFGKAVIVIIVGSILGVSLLAAVGKIGAREGVPTMALFRPILGIRGSWVPSALNVAQLVGWTAVELWAISLVADIVSKEVFGFSARWLWLILASVGCTALALWGPVGVTRVWMQKFGAWAIGAISLILTVILIADYPFDTVFASVHTSGFNGVGLGLDLVIAMPVSWLPLVADYNRYARDERSAVRGTFAGYLLANVWFYTLGLGIVIATVSGGGPAGIAAGILAIAGGSLAGLLFLTGLLAGESDEAFADIYSGAISLRNIRPEIPQWIVIVAVSALSTALAGWLNMERYESFLLLIGSVFLPLFGVFITYYFTNAKPGRALCFSAWILGFLVFHLILPTGPAWWFHLLEPIVVDPSGGSTWLSASIPSFLVALAASWGGARLSSARTPIER